MPPYTGPSDVATDWQEWPQRLWGGDWIAPMSEVLAINRRTIERWRAGEGAPHPGLQQELQRLAAYAEPRSVGIVLRRLARGETLDDIRRDLRAMQTALTRVAAEAGKYATIPVLEKEIAS